MDVLYLLIFLAAVVLALGWYVAQEDDGKKCLTAVLWCAFAALTRDVSWAARITAEFAGACLVSFADEVMSSDEDAHGSARFLTGIEKWELLSLWRDGLVIDGVRRISQERSFEHLALVAPTGAGKTTRFVVPNLLRLADEDVSLVATDPAGELYGKTAGYLDRQGYEVKVINAADPAASLRFNPLYRPENHTEVQKIAEILVDAAYPDSSGGQRFWNDGAKTLLSILIRCLNRTPIKYQNLHNLRYLLNHFGTDGEDIEPFVRANADESTRTEWRGFCNQQKRVVQGMVSGAKTALSPFADPDLNKLTATETLHFESLRTEPTALFVCVPEHEIRHYAPLLTLLYTQIFSYCMDQPSSSDTHRPIFFLLEEAGNIGRIPDFATLMTTLRKRQCSVSIVLQDIQQLTRTYGRAAATTILGGGCASRLYLPGMSPETCLQVERTLGRATIEVEEPGPHRPHETPTRTRERKMGRSLMTADEIRVMSDDEALFIHGNKRPVKLRTTPYYQNARLRRRTELEAPSLPDPDAEEEESIPTLSIRPELPDEPDNWK